MRYTVTMSWGETWTLLGNFANGTCPICTEEDDGEVFPTPYVVGDAAHSPLQAAKLIAEWWDVQATYLGEDGHVAAVDAQ